MPERLYLSLWIRGFEGRNMLRHFGAMLRQFPFSRLRPGLDTLRVYALEDRGSTTTWGTTCASSSPATPTSCQRRRFPAARGRCTPTSRAWCGWRGN
jgi:hypothetical protein